MQKSTHLLTKLFGFNTKVHSIKTEIIAGVTTFLTMAYILAVNPYILSSTGMDIGALFTATALASAVATILLAVYAKMPLAQAPAMGINAFFAYTLVSAMGYSWETALTIVLIEGIIFILLTAFNIRDKIINAIPASLKDAIPVGIGFFIAFVGFKNSGIIVSSSSTYIALGEINASTLIALFGIFLSAILLYKRVIGALFISIIICTICALALGVIEIPQGFSIISKPQSITPTLFKFDFKSMLNIEVIIITIILVFMDIFNTLGTLVGTAAQAGYIDKNGKIFKAKEVLMADAIGTTVGASLGTSTVTTYVESSAGIAEGGRTGLTAFVTGILFLIALLFSPLFLLIPGIATAGALVAIGVFMMPTIKNINFSNIGDGIPCLLTMLLIVFTNSISDGISLGILSYTIINLFTRERKKITVAQYLITLLIIFQYLYSAL